VASGVKIFHEVAEHAAALGEKFRVERVACQAAAAEVFVDQNPHGEPRETVWLLGRKVCCGFPV
jgi:hypothetical protein